MDILQLQRKAAELRADVLTMITNAGSGHPGGSLSMMEIIVALFYRQMKIDPENPSAEGRDRFVLSKGHAAPALYAVLADKGFIDKREIENFRQLGSCLQGHPDKKKTPGIDASTGSLGQGVAIAGGMALGAKRSGNDCQIYTVVGDGELQEGLVWEAAMAAVHYKLDNLTVIVDNNGLQIDGRNDEVMSLGSIPEKYRAFGFKVFEIDGHDFEQILGALAAVVFNKPKCIVAHTVKGKGVSFMEDKVEWHGKSPSSEQLQQALKELIRDTDK